MAVNPLLSLQARAIDLAPAGQAVARNMQFAQQRDQQQELIDLRKENLDLEKIRTGFEQQDAQTKRRIRNTAIASLQLKRALENSPEAAMNFLEGSIEGNNQLGLDSNETQEAIELLKSGNVDRLNTILGNNILVGESLGLIEQPETFQPVYDDQNNIIGQRSSTSGKVVKDPRAPTQPLVNVSVGGEKFAETLNKQTATRINDLVETGRLAVNTEQNLSQMADLLAEGVQTGTLQPALTSIQGLAQDFGVDIESAAQKVGIENLSNLSGKEEFDRLAKTVIIDGFEKFKGNLNDREVKIAMDAFANLGKSEDANVQAIASLMASQSLAKDRGRRASQVDSRAEAKALEAELFDDSLERFKRLKSEFETDIRERMTANNQQAQDAGLPQSAIDAGVSVELWQEMNEEERKAFQ